MSRVLLICFLLFCVSQAAFAQDPNPGDPPQIEQSMTVSDGTGDPLPLAFGLDKRATDGWDTDSGLAEQRNLPDGAPTGFSASFLRIADQTNTYRDFRFGDGRDQSETHYLQVSKTANTQTTLTVSWTLESFVTGVIKDVDDGSTLAVMQGSGSYEIPNNVAGLPSEPLLEIEITYTNIPQDRLPVELTSFDALLEGDVAHLNWETASELNNAGFEVQQKLNGTFQTIGFVQGNGTTDLAQSYSYSTNPLSSGMHTFRLKQVDFDGAFEYSDEVSVEIAMTVPAELSEAYPNPFNPQTQFTLTIARQQAVTIEVYDMLGRQVQTLYQGVLAPSEAHLFLFEAADLPSGRYFIRAAGEFFNSTQTVTLLK